MTSGLRRHEFKSSRVTLGKSAATSLQRSHPCATMKMKRRGKRHLWPAQRRDRDRREGQRQGGAAGAVTWRAATDSRGFAPLSEHAPIVQFALFRSRVLSRRLFSVLRSSPGRVYIFFTEQYAPLAGLWAKLAPAWQALSSGHFTCCPVLGAGPRVRPVRHPGPTGVCLGASPGPA